MEELIVIVEDDEVISELVEYNLKSSGYAVLAFRDSKSFIEAHKNIEDVSLFILDIMLPGMDGISLCRYLREKTSFKDVPVIMLTALGSEADKVKALDFGADDYITKPFGVREFLARVNANIRRYRNSSIETTAVDTKDIQDEQMLRLYGILLDDARHRVFKNGKEIEMTNREFELLKFMMRNKGIAYSREALLEYVWGYEFAGETRTVDVHIRQLRRKLEEDDKEPLILETVRGRGYRFSDQQRPEEKL